MSIRGIARRATAVGYATPTNAPIYVDSDDNLLKTIPAGSGTTEKTYVDTNTAQTLTSKTLTAPIITDATVNALTVEYLADGAIATTPHIAVLTSTDAGAYTIATTATNNVVIHLVNDTSFAHVITGTNLFWAGVTGGPFNKITTAAFPGFCGRIISRGGVWLVESSGLGVLTVGD
jgi:hypothetical protein